MFPEGCELFQLFEPCYEAKRLQERFEVHNEFEVLMSKFLESQTNQASVVRAAQTCPIHRCPSSNYST